MRLDSVDLWTDDCEQINWLLNACNSKSSEKSNIAIFKYNWTHISGNRMWVYRLNCNLYRNDMIFSKKQILKLLLLTFVNCTFTGLVALRREKCNAPSSSMRSSMLENVILFKKLSSEKVSPRIIIFLQFVTTTWNTFPPSCGRTIFCLHEI